MRCLNVKVYRRRRATQWLYEDDNTAKEHKLRLDVAMVDNEHNNSRTPVEDLVIPSVWYGEVPRGT